MACDTAIKYNPAGSGVNTSTKAEPAASATTEDTDDSISVTSTPYDSEDPDVEYTVEDILAQDDDMDGVTKYLVRWANYPLEKCTWEPEENMGHELLRDLWEKKKKRRDYKPFDLGLHYGALAQKEERHFRRNVKRKRLGLPETFPFLEGEEAVASEPVAEAEPTKDVADAATGTYSVSAVEEPASVMDPNGAMEPASVNGAATKLTDLTNDLNDDIVVLDAISAPATSAAPKTKKKKKKKTVSAKDKTEAASKPLPKHKDSVEAGPSRPTNRVSASSTASGTLPEKPKQPEKRKSTDGERNTNPAEVAKNPKGLSEAVRRMPEQRSSNQSLQQVNAPTTVNAKESASSSKPGQISEPTPRNSNTFSARRSATAPQTTCNASSSGQKTGTRSNLATAMSDPSKPKKLFTNRHMLRQAEKIERDKPDRIIDPSLVSAQLFPISQGPPRAPAPSAKSGNRQDKVIPQPPPVSSPDPEAMPTLSPVQGPSRSILATGRPPATAPKRKKSVHFAVTSGGDDEVYSNRTRLTSPPAGGFSTTDHDDLTMHIEPEKSEVPMPDRVMGLLAGSQKEPVEAVFSVMAEPHSTKTLLDEVFGNNLIRFDYSCLAGTLLQQLGGIREKNLFSGNIKACPEKKSSGESLETISKRLMTMNAGLFLLKPAFAILLYPTRCQDWSEEKFGFPAPGAGQVIAPLRYVVFKTYFDGSSLLRPPSGAAGDFSIPSNVGEREYLMKVFSGLDHESYARLFPRRDVPEKVKRNVFLTFPPSLYPSMQQLAFWIRAMDPCCAVFYSTVPGAWMAFRDKITMDSEDGAIIVHELVVSAIRRFPDLHSFLSAEDGACRLWALSQSILSPPIFSPIVQLDLDEPDGGERSGDQMVLGKITWTQLFPHGLAIFVTPSLIVSEPRRTYDLFRWVSNAHRVGDILVTLVTAWDICGFLRIIANEKHRQRNKNLGGRAHRADPDRREDAVRARDSDVDCRLRFETCLLANEICETRETAYFLPIAFADEAIDWNDEQSLVNWFGWWSSVHVDQYRLFHVVGTDMALEYKHSELAVRTIPAPIFGSETVADPDVAKKRMQETIDAVARASGICGSSQPTPSNARPSLPPQALRSRRFLDDSPSAFTGFLMSASPEKDFWRVYGYAVVWRDSNEAFKSGSLQSNPHTIKDWFSFTWPFTSTRFRTYIGFFYVVDDSCDELRADQGDKVPLPRHPFVVIYRPERPHMSPFKRTELIFWDPRAKNKFRGRDVLYETSDLTAGQRAVLDHVREFGPEKNTKLPLSNIYIGGEPYKPGNDRHGGAIPPLLNELDATAEYLDHLARDPKDVVPPSHVYLKAKGFKEVIMSGDKRDDREMESRNTGETMAMKGEGGKTTIVFHAPRGERMRHVGSSKCRNRFYDTARQVRMQNPRSTMMEFEYRPTTEWYREQVEEGRGHDHIRVDGWEAFFTTFRVGKS